MNMALLKEKPLEYQDLVGLVEIAEFNKGFKIKKVGKATKKGTVVQYEAIIGIENYQSLKKDIVNRLAHLIKPTSTN